MDQTSEALHRLVDQAGLSSMLIVDLLAIIHRIDPQALAAHVAELEEQRQSSWGQDRQWIERRLEVLSVRFD